MLDTVTTKKLSFLVTTMVTTVSDLLRLWNMTDEIVMKFAEESIDIEALKNLLLDDLKILIPSIGLRTKFRVQWLEWKNPIEKSLESPKNSVAKEPLCESPLAKRPLFDSTPSIPSSGDCNPLRNLLEQSSVGKQLLRSGLQREFRRSEQSELCDIILEYLLKGTDDPRPKLAYSVFWQWSKYIHNLFPREPESIWFCVTPAVKKETRSELSPGAKPSVSASARPHGKLYDRYGKRQAIWRERQGLVKKRTIGSDSPNAPTIEDSNDGGPVRRRYKKGSGLPDNDHDIDQNLLEEELRSNDDITTISQYQGLESSSTLETAWKATWILRKRYLLSVPSVAQYLEKFPLLLLPKIGPHLINIDFSILNPQVSPSALYTGLRKNADYIELRALSKLRSLSKTLRVKQERIHDLPKGTELLKIAASLLLLPFAVVGGKTAVRTKASRFDAASHFIFFAKTRSEGEAHLQELRQEVAKKPSLSRIGVQPLVIALGEDITNISNAFAVIDNVWFFCDNIVEAVDLCFKCFYVFNLRYPTECEHIWQVLQFICYGIRDIKVDKYIIDVNSFTNDIDRNSSSQETGHSYSQGAGHSSSQEAGHSSSQEAGHSSSQETGHSSSQVTGHSSTQEVENSSSQETDVDSN